MLLPIGEVSKKLGLHPDTLRNWERQGKIKSVRTPGGHRRYNLDDIMLVAHKSEYVSAKLEKKTAIYCRVSNSSRKNDLENQRQVLELFCASKGWTYTVIEDIGSGLDDTKKGLLELIKLIETDQLERIVLNDKDRLLRYGAEIIYEICKYHQVEIVVLNESESNTYKEELVQDVLSAITDFSAKLYGSRSHKNKKIIEENKKLFTEE